MDESCHTWMSHIIYECCVDTSTPICHPHANANVLKYTQSRNSQGRKINTHTQIWAHKHHTHRIPIWYSRVAKQIFLKHKQTHYFWKKEEKISQECTGWRRPIGCLIFVGHFPHKRPIISGSVARNDLRVQAPYGSAPPVTPNYTTVNIFSSSSYFLKTGGILSQEQVDTGKSWNSFFSPPNFWKREKFLRK